MHIETPRIRNFRRLKNVQIDLAPDISIFVGANNSGKTSASQALQLFTAASRDRFTIHDFNAESWREMDAFGEQEDGAVLPHLEYRDLEGTDPNFLGVKESSDAGYYRILIDRSQEEIVAKLEELKAAIEKGDLKPWEFQGMKAIWFGNHLYQPLLCLDKNIVEISPAPLNKGERQVVEDLKAFHDGNADFFKTRELYLLRNLSKGRGVGFFEAGNFHPDFILWLLAGGKQHIIFVDPKGIRNLGPTDPKIQFHETIKEIEQRLGDPNVRLQSFIVSNTSSATMMMLWSMKKSEMQKRHVLFQDEDRDNYVGSMLDVAGT